MSFEKEGPSGQDESRTRTTGQETVAQASAMARYARRAQAAQDATATAPDSPRGVGARARLQEGDQEAREEALKRG